MNLNIQLVVVSVYMRFLSKRETKFVIHKRNKYFTVNTLNVNPRYCRKLNLQSLGCLTP